MKQKQQARNSRILLNLIDLVFILFLVFFYLFSFRIQEPIVLFIGLIVICRVRHVRMVMGRVLLE